jgi:hypothetical protein
VTAGWTDVTAEAGILSRTTGCLVFDDLDGDQDPDILLGSELLTIYENRGDGTFESIELNLDLARISSCAAADVTGDGVKDIILGHAFPAGVSVLEGKEAFEYERQTSALPELPVDPETVIAIKSIGIFNLDRDGRLDIAVGAMHRDIASCPKECTCGSSDEDYACWLPDPSWSGSAPIFFLRNEGKGSFSLSEFSTEVDSSTVAVHSLGFHDWDGDGFVDVLASADFGAAGFYRNREGTGAFQNMAATLGVGDYGNTMGTAFGDFDRDGNVDIYVTDAGPDQLYFSSRDGRLIKRGLELGVTEWTRHHWAWSPIAADFNLDGYEDIYVVNTAVVEQDEDLAAVAKGKPVLTPPRQGDSLLMNDRTGGFDFSLVPRNGGVPTHGPGLAATADFDADGDLDLLVSSGLGEVRLLRNDMVADGGWLKVLALDGDVACLGAEVSISTERDGSMRRVIGAGGGAGGSQSSGVVHFGLGAATEVNRVTVTWPDGSADELDGPVAADQVVIMTRHRRR